MIEQTSVFQITEKEVEQVVVFISKESKQVTILESMKIDQPVYLPPVEVTVKPFVLEEVYEEN